MSCALAALASVCAALTRERTLIVTRHGIRVPFPPFEGLPIGIFSKDTARKWYTDPEAWGASKIAALTDHGKEVIRLMGSHVGDTVLPSPPYNFTVYADLDHTNRDIETAEAFMRGARPDANFSVSEWDRTHPEYMRWLFNQGNASTAKCQVSGNLPAVISAQIGGNFTRVSVEQQDNIMRLSEALDCCQPAVCAVSRTASGRVSALAGAAQPCTLMGVRTYWEGQKAYWETFRGPITASSALIEYVQLMYLNGMDWEELVRGPAKLDCTAGACPGPMSAIELRRLMRMHERVMSIADDYWNAQHAGSEMLVHLAATFEQAVRPEVPIAGLRSSASDALVYYAAHDINIYFLRRLLNLNWLTESFNPNESPPGGFLTFELYSMSSTSATQAVPAATKSFFVKAFFMSQSYDQQRHATPLSPSQPASRVFAMIPACASGPELSCPFDDFKALVLQLVLRECVQLVDPAVLEPTDGSSYPVPT